MSDSLDDALNAAVAEPVKPKAGRKVRQPEPEPEPETVPVETIVPLFEPAARASCTCGEKMARKAEAAGVENVNPWSCLRVLTGNAPTAVCQRGIRHDLILAKLPPAKKLD